MTFEDCLDVIEGLSYSQGFYGRLMRDIMGLDEWELEDLKDAWESMEFADMLDFIMYLEC